MKLISRHVERDKSGYMKFEPEEPEDLWHAYNLITAGDIIRASTFRKVQSESATGSVESQKIRLTLQLEVEDTTYDGIAHTIAVKGKNVSETKYVKLGQYHTLELAVNRQFTLTKLEWDFISLERVEQACNVTKRAHVAAIVLQEGLANVCLVTDYMTVVRQRVEVSIPKKGRGSTSQYDKAIQRFFDQIYQALVRHINLDIVKVVLIASPGYLKDDVYQYIFAQAVRAENKLLLENKPKFMVLHCSSGHKNALDEILRDPLIANRLADTQFASEAKCLDRFHRILQDDPCRAFYGSDHIIKAAELGAIDTLMISDSLFKNVDPKLRRKYIDIVSNIRKSGGKALIYSSMHVTGEQLNNLTGIAAILSFPIPELDEEIDSR